MLAAIYEGGYEMSLGTVGRLAKAPNLAVVVDRSI